ncbi:MAG: hypothetical protein ACREHC_04120, partial [Candidatus Levyibacteriota bacterium]
MSESSGPEAYSYEGIMPQDVQTWGFTIERSDVKGNVPLGEIFKDPRASMQRAKTDLKEHITTGDNAVTVITSDGQQDKNDGATVLHLDAAPTGEETTNEAILKAID